MKCLICGIEYEKRVSLCNHIRSIHKLSKQEYYDKYIKTELEGICKYEGCKKPTIFLDIENGYKECCCLEHTNLYRYGVKSNLNLEETKNKAQKNSHTKEAAEKQRKTNLERYGSIAPMGNKKIQEKSKRTCIEKYGADNPFRSEQIKAQNARNEKEAIKLAKKAYNIISNNCEHFANECLFGTKESEQVNEIFEKAKQFYRR